MSEEAPPTPGKPEPGSAPTDSDAAPKASSPLTDTSAEVTDATAPVKEAAPGAETRNVPGERQHEEIMRIAEVPIRSGMRELNDELASIDARTDLIKSQKEAKKKKLLEDHPRKNHLLTQRNLESKTITDKPITEEILLTVDGSECKLVHIVSTNGDTFECRVFNNTTSKEETRSIPRSEVSEAHKIILLKSLRDTQTPDQQRATDLYIGLHEAKKSGRSEPDVMAGIFTTESGTPMSPQQINTWIVENAVGLDLTTAETLRKYIESGKQSEIRTLVLELRAGGLDPDSEEYKMQYAAKVRTIENRANRRLRPLEGKNLADTDDVLVLIGEGRLSPERVSADVVSCTESIAKRKKLIDEWNANITDGRYTSGGVKDARDRITQENTAINKLEQELEYLESVQKALGNGDGLRTLVTDITTGAAPVEIRDAFNEAVRYGNLDNLTTQAFRIDRENVHRQVADKQEAERTANAREAQHKKHIGIVLKVGGAVGVLGFLLILMGARQGSQ